jgi:hypothetical protein
MPNLAEGIRVTLVPTEIQAAFLLEPPGWTRLEPQSVSGDPTPGMEARIHDPLWLLARQWQLGEFDGEDAGTPVSVRVQAASGRVTAWQPGDPRDGAGAARGWDGESPLDPAVEREPTPARGPGLRARIEGGSQFLAMLADAGLDAVRVTALERCALDRDNRDGKPGDPDRWAERRLRKLFGGRVPDAELLANEIDAGPPPGPPRWMSAGLSQAHAHALDGIVERWWEWYRGQVAPPADPSEDSWVDERLEYRFRIGMAGRDGQAVLDAPAFDGGRVDWHAFDAAADGAALEPAADGPEALVDRDQTVLATPLTFSGMPADRYWEFEDGQVNLASLDVQPHDLPRLALVEFAVVYGNDWLVVPFDVPAGSLTRIESVSYTTTFGETYPVSAADQGAPGQRFRLFAVSESDAEGTIGGLLCPPTAPARMEGLAVEEVLFGRDEMANTAWGIERRVQGASGTPRERSDEPGPEPLEARTEPEGAELDYLLQTDVPARWIPFVPVAKDGSAWSIELRKGALLDRHDPPRPVHPVGVLLRPHQPLVVSDEEVPREGVRVERVPVLCRDQQGKYLRWITRRATVGRGEPASALAYDSAIQRR